MSAVQAVIPEGREHESLDSASDLSERQADIVEKLAAYRLDHDWSPTLRELMRRTGIRSTSHMVYHLDDLEAKGYIERGNGSRALALTQKGWAVAGVNYTPPSELLRKGGE